MMTAAVRGCTVIGNRWKVLHIGTIVYLPTNDFFLH